MLDPVTLSLLASSAMNLGGNYLGGRAQDKASRRSTRQDALGNLTGALGSPGTGAVRPQGGAGRSGLADAMRDPVVAQLLQQLIAGGGGQGGALWKLLGGGGPQAINQAAQGMMGRSPGLRGAGLNMMGAGSPRQLPPGLSRTLGGR